ncbi:MAG TPA: hypothetical protein DD806_06550 [Flavobacterium sp.]|nr:hypothetical protein [Flavobacterium sp.]
MFKCKIENLLHMYKINKHLITIIEKLDSENNVIETFDSIAEAKRKTGLTVGKLSLLGKNINATNLCM